MSLCIEGNLQQLIDAVNRIEQHIGLSTATDSVTVNGRIYNMTGLNFDTILVELSTEVIINNDGYIISGGV